VRIGRARCQLWLASRAVQGTPRTAAARAIGSGHIQHWLRVLCPNVCYISRRNALNIPILFTNKEGTVADEALVDSGAMENFMDKATARRLGIGRIRMHTPKIVKNVDGTENKEGRITHFCIL
jgi:hypothetical protein